MELNIWTAGERPHARVVDGDARLEVELPADEATPEQLDTLVRVLWGEMQEQRHFLRGEF